MSKHAGVEIEKILPGSPAFLAGIAPGDTLISTNGHRVHDAIDFMFHRGEGELNVLVSRKDKRISCRVPLKEGQDAGIVLKPFKIRTCTNRCIFCFVNQLPRGLRKSLYVKDEDYRMSFLYGNYITLTNLTSQDKRRIIQQRLSPIYLSVHSTNRAVRNAMLGNPKAQDVLKEIEFFKENRIRMHCQIVLTPGFNDGKELERTIRDLYKFYPYVSSIAVVPVGLTAYRKTTPKVRPVEKDDALRALELIGSFRKRFGKKHGDPIVYGADELYIKAGTEFPPLREYGDLPQIENGVGLVPLFLHQSKRIKIPQGDGRRRFVTFTGASFYPYLSRFAERLGKSGIDIDVVGVENMYFGRSVTVAGLLTGRDVMRSLPERVKKDDILLIPDVVMREGDALFLDDVSLGDLEDLLGTKTVLIPATPKGIVDAVATLSRATPVKAAN
jgi:putative radical SAM enzyme (TIGR03279 family)